MQSCSLKDEEIDINAQLDVGVYDAQLDDENRAATDKQVVLDEVKHDKRKKKKPS